MKYTPIDTELFIQNRKKLSKKLKKDAIAIFNSNDIYPSNGDGIIPFIQNDNLYYLTGIDQEETILIVAPDFPKDGHQEILFIKETSEMIAIWEGHKYTKKEATEASGITSIYWTHEFDSVLQSLMAESSIVYLDANEHIRASNEVQTRTDRFNQSCRRKYPLHTYERSAPLMGDLRMVKEEHEISALQEACDITEKGFRRALSFIKPGVAEYEIEAEFLHEFIRNRSSGFGYEPIVASGPNACILHYTDNNQVCRQGDVILMDIGASYANYNADMTRVVPVSGKFSDRQKAVYNAVLAVKKEAEKLLCPGVLLQEFTKEVCKAMEQELLKLKLIDKTDIENQSPEAPVFRKYFMHGVSHHLGIGVHDIGSPYRKVTENMVFTIEPGIYIREEGIGMRLEDNYVVKSAGNVNLMKNIPIEIEEIEYLMNQPR